LSSWSLEGGGHRLTEENSDLGLKDFGVDVGIVYGILLTSRPGRGR